MTRPLYLLALMLVSLYSCKNNPGNTSKTEELNSVTNLMNKEVPSDSIKNFIDHKMKEMNIPGLSLAIINDGQVVCHMVKGYADVEKKSLVDDRYKQITARMVLSHTAGFPNWRPDYDLIIHFDPGTDFRYSGEGYIFLERVIQSILNTDYKGMEAYFQEKVAVPFKMLHTKYVQDDYNISHKATAYMNGERLPKNEKVVQEFISASNVHSEALDFSKWLS